MSHQLLIYHSDSKLYEEILLKRLPQLEIRSAINPEDALDFIEEAEIILSWQIPDDLLKKEPYYLISPGERRSMRGH